MFCMLPFLLDNNIFSFNTHAKFFLVFKLKIWIVLVHNIYVFWFDLHLIFFCFVNISIADLQAAIVIYIEEVENIFERQNESLRNKRQILGTIDGCFLVGETFCLGFQTSNSCAQPTKLIGRLCRHCAQ